MPADLDDLFTTLSRQADAIPLAGVEHARRRGRQRRARGLAALAAAAVVLVIAGTGLALNRPHTTPEPLLPATDPARLRGLAPVGEPLRIAEGRMWNNTRIAGERVIGFSSDGNGGHETVALDARTGATLWRITGRESYYRGVATTSTVVMLLRELASQSEAVLEPTARILEFHDAVTGEKTWELPHTDHDRFVLHEDVLVRLIGETTVIEGYDLATGRKLWTAPPGHTPGDTSSLVPAPPRLISGMRVEADGGDDADGTTWALGGPDTADAIPYTDDRLVDMSRSGKVTIRDIRTGEVRSTASGRPNAEHLLAYEGTVYTQVRVGDLIGVASLDRILYQYREEDSWSYAAHFPCGRDRLCVIEDRPITEERSESRIVLIDAKSGKVLRTTGAVPRHGENSMRAGRILTSGTGQKATTLYDENGAARYSDYGVGGFVDDGNALSMSQDAGDRRFTVRGVSTVDYQKVELGVIPEISGRCDWNEEILTCPTGRELGIWRFNR
ncbi:PQQ-binding-like beta-propeller repeat protein [Actinoplanes xinjiangensis]|uniref:outer membrane protein assembly factor BamB family protein n=1 Tax=Actinoplanes xinjiangensis TaxID=512350 RepID=UPI0034333DFC